MNKGLIVAGPAAEKLATQMQDAWLAFARSGDPSNESTGQWKPYDEAHRSTMIFGANTKLEDAPRDEERRAWEGVPDKIFGSL
jgi:para-nitrobenzyl esterase